MIELYGSPTPSACTITIMLEEIGCHYAVFPINKNNPEQSELEFLKMTPANIFPVLLDRDGPQNKPFAIVEPGAILMYLAEKSGKFMPTSPTERFEVLQWLWFESAKIAPTLGNTKHFMYHAPQDMPYAIKRFNNETKRIFSIVEKQLSENPYLGGEYSIADIATFPWLKDHDRYGISATQIPNTVLWLTKLGEREGFQKGLEALVDLKEN